jgi:hypothetical protein
VRLHRLFKDRHDARALPVSAHTSRAPSTKLSPYAPLPACWQIAPWS